MYKAPDKPMDIVWLLLMDNYTFSLLSKLGGGVISVTLRHYNTYKIIVIKIIYVYQKQLVLEKIKNSLAFEKEEIRGGVSVTV